MVNDGRHYIIYGGLNSADYDAFVDGSQTFGSAVRSFETVEIEGRNGDLHIDKNRYSNIEITYSFYFHDSEDLEHFRSDIMALKGYQRLQDTHHPNEYRQAIISSSFDATMYGNDNKSGGASLTFNCKPQRYLVSGEVPQTFSYSSSKQYTWNPSAHEAKPLIRVYGSGVLGIGDNTITIASHSYDYLDIDCELLDCFYGTVNMNSYVTFNSNDFPILSEGRTGISTGSGITKVLITPRWWIL